MQTFELTALDHDLVAKDQDLDLLRPLAAHAQHDQLQHLTQDQVSERQDHGGQPAAHRATGNAQNRRSTPKTLFSSGTGRAVAGGEAVVAPSVTRRLIDAFAGFLPDPAGASVREEYRNAQLTAREANCWWMSRVDDRTARSRSVSESGRAR